MALSDTRMKAIDDSILKLLLDNFEYACHILKVDKIQAYVCLERSKGKTNGEIATTLGISRIAVFKRANKCECNQPVNDIN